MADRTHLHRAAQRGDIGAVRALVEAVDVNIKVGWRVESPLHAASRAGRSDVIECLMKAGAHTEVRDRNNDTPLLLAAWLGHADAVQKLLMNGARVGAEGIARSALHCACMQGHVRCVFELLRGGADETALDEDGNTPVEVIATMGEAEDRPEDIRAIRTMLERAPADRCWRRRGWVVILRARDSLTAAARVKVLPAPRVLTRSAAKLYQLNVAESASGPVTSSIAELTYVRKEVMTRRSRGAAAGGQGLRKCAKGPAVDRTPSSRRSKLSSRGSGKSPGLSGAEAKVNTRSFASLVETLVGMGEEGAFRHILSFL